MWTRGGAADESLRHLHSRPIVSQGPAKLSPGEFLGLDATLHHDANPFTHAGVQPNSGSGWAGIGLKPIYPLQKTSN